MRSIAVLYATRHGQAHRVAEHVAIRLRQYGLGSEVHDVWALPKGFDLDTYEGVILVASLHHGRHEREMVAFAKAHRAIMSRMPTAFLSVSGREATAEAHDVDPETRVRASREVQGTIERFIEQTGWRPRRVKAVAGALLYTQYNFLRRFLVRRSAKRAGRRIDVTRDRYCTDWPALDRFIGELGVEMAA